MWFKFIISLTLQSAHLQHGIGVRVYGGAFGCIFHSRVTQHLLVLYELSNPNCFKMHFLMLLMYLL